MDNPPKKTSNYLLSGVYKTMTKVDVLLMAAVTDEGFLMTTSDRPKL